jgi:hypothetical protein
MPFFSSCCYAAIQCVICEVIVRSWFSLSFCSVQYLRSFVDISRHRVLRVDKIWELSLGSCYMILIPFPRFIALMRRIDLSH